MFLLHHVFSRQEFQALPVFGYLNIPWKKPLLFTTWENFYLGHEFSKHRNHKQIQENGNGLDMGVSKNNVTPMNIHFKRVFHYKPSFLGLPYFWKHPHKPIHGFMVYPYKHWITGPLQVVNLPPPNLFSNFRPTTPGGVTIGRSPPPHDDCRSALMSYIVGGNVRFKQEADGVFGGRDLYGNKINC